MNAVGFNEVRLADDAPAASRSGSGRPSASRPDLLDALGAKSRDHPLALVLTPRGDDGSDGAQPDVLAPDGGVRSRPRAVLGGDSDDDA